MENQQTGMAVLNRLLDILKREKEVLIKNEGSKLDAIVKEKELFLQEAAACDFSSLDAAALESVMRSIHQLQETNLMLTKQAIRFQDTVLAAMKKDASQSGNTYSNKGRHTAANQASLLNQSL